MTHYTKKQELAFFKENKFDMDIPTNISIVNIPAPTEDDLAWAKAIYKTPLKKVIPENRVPESTWRLAFLMTMPKGKESRFLRLIKDNTPHNAPKTSYYQEQMTHYLKQDNIDAMALCSAFSTDKTGRTEILRQALETKPVSFLKEAVEKMPSDFKEIFENQDLIKPLVAKGNLETMTYLIESGIDILEHGESYRAIAKQNGQAMMYSTVSQKHLEVHRKVNGPAEQKRLALRKRVIQEEFEENEWEYMGPNQIARHGAFNDSSQSLTEVFNFDSEQVISTHHDKYLNTTSSFAQNFRDVQNQKHIEKAAQKLQEFADAPIVKRHRYAYDAAAAVPLKKRQLHA